jgi:hypothetical protein
MQRWMSAVLWVLLAVGGCGGGASTATTGSGGGSGGEGAPPALGPEGCTGHDASREAVCVSSGCRWGQSLVCMGTELPDDEALPPQPCACICAEDELACSRVPSAPPAP